MSKRSARACVEALDVQMGEALELPRLLRLLLRQDERDVMVVAQHQLACVLDDHADAAGQLQVVEQEGELHDLRASWRSSSSRRAVSPSTFLVTPRAAAPRHPGCSAGRSRAGAPSAAAPRGRPARRAGRPRAARRRGRRRAGSGSGRRRRDGHGGDLLAPRRRVRAPSPAARPGAANTWSAGSRLRSSWTALSPHVVTWCGFSIAQKASLGTLATTVVSSSVGQLARAARRAERTSRGARRPRST